MVPEQARTQSTFAIAPERADRPRRETRRPAKYEDYECYTLQSQKVHSNKGCENCTLQLKEKQLREQQSEYCTERLGMHQNIESDGEKLG